MEGYRIRRLTPDDAARARDMRLQALKEHPLLFRASYESEAAWPVERYADGLREPFYFGAFLGDELLAIAALKQPEETRFRHNGWIDGMYVAPAARGGSLARDLLDHMLEDARARGVEIVKLVVSTANEAAVRFYLRMGFSQYGQEPDAMRVDGVSYKAAFMSRAV